MFAPLLIAASLVSVPPVEPLPTAAELAAGLTRVRAAVREVCLVWQERAEQNSAPNVPLGPPWGQWMELFLAGDAAQMRVKWASPPPGAVDWWPVGVPAGVPLTGATAADHDGRLICLRPSGDGPVRSQLVSGLVPDAAGGTFSDQLYTTHADFEPLSPTVPYLFAGRSWSGGMSANQIDQFAATDPAGWVVEGREVKSGRPAIRVLAIPDAPPALPDETSSIIVDYSSGVRVWFTDDERRDLFRVESVAVRWVDGEVASIAEDAPSSQRTTWADDFRPLPGGARMPFAGGQTFRAVTGHPVERDPVRAFKRSGGIGASLERTTRSFFALKPDRSSP